MQILEGHVDEIFSCAFNSAGNTIITGSKDNTCRIWNSQSMLECAADGIAVGCENGKMLHPQAPCLLEDEEKAENHKIDDGEFGADVQAAFADSQESQPFYLFKVCLLCQKCVCV